MDVFNRVDKLAARSPYAQPCFLADLDDGERVRLQIDGIGQGMFLGGRHFRRCHEPLNLFLRWKGGRANRLPLRKRRSVMGIYEVDAIPGPIFTMKREAECF